MLCVVRCVLVLLSLVVAGCVLLVGVCWLLFVVRCVSFVSPHLLGLFAVECWLLVAGCLLSVVCCFCLLIVRCSLTVAC